MSSNGQRAIRIPSWELGECEIPAGCQFSQELANHAEEFFPKHCHHTKGRWAGVPFRLAEFQRRDIREIFGRVDASGNRIIRTVYKEIPKKSGKSEEAAGVALKLLFADHELGAEIYGAASDRDQAGIIFHVAAAMVRYDPNMLRLTRGGRDVLDSTKRIAYRGQDSFYRAISSDVAGKHGYNAHGVIFDEVHTQPDMRLWEVLTFGSGAAREQPLVYAITTAGVVGESPVAEMLHEEADQILRGVVPCPPSFYPVLYAAPDDADWHSEDTWQACNPALGTAEEVRDGKKFLPVEAVREEYQRALRHFSEQNSFLRLRLNRWVRQEVRAIDMEDWDRGGVALKGADAGLRYAEWVRQEIRELRDYTWFGGLDLSTKLDLTAFVVVCIDPREQFHVLPWFWIPTENLADRQHIEAGKYREWIKQGFLTATDGNSVDFVAVRQRISEIGKQLRISQIAFDPAFATETAQELTKSGHVMVELKQGFMTWTEAWDKFAAALRDGRVLHGGHPVLRWNADNLCVKQNAAGLTRSSKPDRQKSSKRIDGLVATMMGVNRAILSNDNRRSIYEDAATAVI